MDPKLKETPRTMSCWRDGKWHVDELANCSAQLERQLNSTQDILKRSYLAIPPGCNTSDMSHDLSHEITNLAQELEQTKTRLATVLTERDALKDSLERMACIPFTEQ